MTRLCVHLYDLPPAKSGKMLLDLTDRAYPPVFGTNRHGFAECVILIPMSRQESFRYYNLVQGWLIITYAGQVVYEGRLEDPKITENGLELNCLGAWRALTDLAFCSSWSDDQVGGWETVTPLQITSAHPDSFSMDTNNRIYVTPNKDAAVSNTPTWVGYISYAFPNLTNRQIVGIQFDYKLKAPASWQCGLQRIDDAATPWTVSSGIWSVNGAGVAGTLQTGSRFLTLTASPRLAFYLYFTVGGTTLGTTIALGVRTVTPASMASIYVGQRLQIGNNGAAALSEVETVEVTAITGTTFTANFKYAHNLADLVQPVVPNETGDIYLEITNLRVLGTTTNQINTTFTANRAAGTAVTATVGSTANMYVGQRLTLRQTGVSESVIVLAVNSATTFTATFVNAYVIGDAVQAPLVLVQEIIQDYVTRTTNTNPNHMSPILGAIQNPGIDLLQAIYEDRTGADVIEELLQLGDNASRIWEAVVYEDRVLQFRPRGVSGRTWYIDETLDIERSLDELYNSAYLIYQDNEGGAVRAIATTDAAFVGFFGLTRRLALAVETTSYEFANAVRNVVISDRKGNLIRGALPVTAVYDSSGAAWPLFMVRSGDLIVARKLPIGASFAVDYARIFRVEATSYDAMTNVLTITPEQRMDRGAFVVGRRDAKI